MSSKYSNLARELAITDFKLKYQGSVLGYLWSFAKPMLLFAILYVVFTKFIKLGAGVENYPLYLLLGIVLWTYFADATMTAMSSIVDRQNLIRKVYFPRLIIVLASSISALITLVLNLLVIMVFMLVAHVYPHLNALLFILLVLELYVLALGASFFLSALYVKFRDFRHIWEVGLQLLFYASPIVYPITLVPARYVKFYILSPIAQILQDSRVLLTSPHAPTASTILHFPSILIPYSIPPVVAVVGYFYFKSAAAKFAEEL